MFKAYDSYELCITQQDVNYTIYGIDINAYGQKKRNGMKKERSRGRRKNNARQKRTEKKMEHRKLATV